MGLLNDGCGTVPTCVWTVDADDADVVLYLVGATVAVLLVGVPLPLLEQVGKTWFDYHLPLVALVPLTEKRNPFSLYLLRTCARPLFSLIVTSFPLPMSLVYVLQILNPYGTLTYDALSAYVDEIGIPLMMVISGLRLRYQKKMSVHLVIDSFVEYLDQIDVLVCDDGIVVVLFVLDHHVVLRPVHQVERVLLPFSSAVILPSQQLP